MYCCAVMWDEQGTDKKDNARGAISPKAEFRENSKVVGRFWG